MRNHKNAIRLILSSALALSVLSGCSSQSQETAADPANAANSASAESTETAETLSAGGEDGVFTIAYAPNESTTESADARNGLAEDLSEF